MARETKAQRAAREAEARWVSWQEATSKWTERVLDLIYQYSHHPSSRFSVEQVNRSTYCFHTTQNYDSNFTISATAPELQDWDAYYDLESAEERLADYRAEKEEEARKHKFWQDAREKAKSLLTPEEFEALGIR